MITTSERLTPAEKAQAEDAMRTCIAKTSRKVEGDGDGLWRQECYLTSHQITEVDFHGDTLWTVRWTALDYYTTPGELARAWGRCTSNADRIDEGMSARAKVSTTV